jgi:predicted nucleic acid-binding protein
MADLVCFDTQAIIWGIKEEATPGQEFMIDRTKRFIKHLDEKRIKILIPTVVYAESLMRIPKELHPMIQNLVERSFIISPFDAKAASIFAEVWQKGKENGTIKGLIKEGSERDFIKFDSQIIATAISLGAECIYSQDSDLTKLANGLIDIREIPNVAEQPPLPRPNEHNKV